MSSRLHSRRALSFAIGIGIGIAVVVSTGVASAQQQQQPPSATDKVQAKEAYDRGLAANARGDHASAATEFARADQLAPSPVALQAALDAAVEADDPTLGGDLLERSQRAPATGELAASIEAAKKKLGGRAGRVRVGCPERATCLATLDGIAITIAKPTWTRTGQHTIVVQVDGESQTRLVDVKANDTVQVMPTPKPAGPATTPPPPPTDKPADPANADVNAKKPNGDVISHGLPPIVFYAGIGATLGLGVTSVVLAFVTKGLHEDFVSSGCDKAAFQGCKDKQQNGETVQIVTDVGFGATALAGIATIVIGIGFTDWKGRSAGSGTRSTPIIAPIAGGGGVVGYGGRF